MLGEEIFSGGLPAIDWRWLALILLVSLTIAAFLCGWFSMIAKACGNYFEAPKEKLLSLGYIPQAFSLFREFLPGVSRLFPAMALGVLLHTAVVMGLLWWVHPALEKLWTLLQTLQANGNDQMDLTPYEPALQAISREMSKASLVYVAFSLLTMLWPAFVVYYHDNALTAYCRSAMQFLRDPLRLIGIGVFFFCLQAVLSLGMFTNSEMVAIFSQFAGWLAEIYMAVVLFVYVYRMVGKPVPEAAEEPAEEPPAV
jgi:hypothetical protein